MLRDHYFTPIRVATFVVAVAIALTLALTPIQSSDEFPTVGRAAARAIVAPDDLSFESAILTQQEREAAAQAVADLVTFDAGVRTAQVAALDQYLRQVDDVRADEELSPTERAEALEAIPDSPASQRHQVLIRGFTDRQWEAVKSRGVALLTELLSSNIESKDLGDVRAGVADRVDDGLSALQAEVTAALARAFIEPTVITDESATAQARNTASAAVDAVQQNFERGEVLVAGGELVDDLLAERLAQLEPEGGSVPGDDLVALLLLAIGSAATLGGYLFIARPDAAASDRRLLLLGVLVVVGVAAARVYLPLVLPEGRDEAQDLMIPLATIPILVAVLLNTSLGVIVSIVLALLAGLSAILHPDYGPGELPTGAQALRPLGVYLFASLAGVFLSVRAERLTQYSVVGLLAGLAGFVASLAFWLFDPVRETSDVAWLALAGAIAAVGTSILSIGAFSVLGFVFGITTRLQLLELAQLTQPLLRRLQEEAPGTFHHSLLVATMAERAATQIDADPLMVRVGAYYHDIGKLSKPHMYIENQSDGSNPHETLDPLESADVIMEHVRWGQELARRERLPVRIRAFVPEHHGTRLVTYFYRKAAMDDPEVDTTRFTYQGPKPQTRETAIVMLADSCEAVVRSSPDHDEAVIARLIDSVIDERLHEHQFDECDVTMRDLRTVAESFKITLGGVYHPRIEYPEPSEAERRSRDLTKVGGSQSAGGEPQSDA